MFPEPAQLVLIGLVVGALGSLVGLGGGVFLVPYLLLVHHLSPPVAAATSLAIVLVNALSGTFAYARLKRIDYRTGVLFALATMPGAVGGPLLLSYVPAPFYRWCFAVLLLGTAGHLLYFRPKAGDRPGIFGGKERRVVDADGGEFRYRVHLPVGSGVSFVAGFLSSMFGVGGGIIHMPLFLLGFGIPIHVAAATSNFVLSLTALAGSAVNVGLGRIDSRFFLLLGAGAVVGAQVGVRLARKTDAVWLRRLLAVVLALVAAQMALRAQGIL